MMVFDLTSGGLIRAWKRTPAATFSIYRDSRPKAFRGDKPKPCNASLKTISPSARRLHEPRVVKMRSWTVLEWIVFAPCLIWTVSTNIALRQHYKNSLRPSLPANATHMRRLTSVVIVAIVGYPPFHLLWL